MSIYNLFNEFIFRIAEKSDIDMISESFRENQGCDFIKEAIQNIEDEDYNNDTHVLIYQDRIIGIVGIEFISQHFYYINFECTASRNILEIYPIFKNKSFFSPGRILWCYILNFIYKTNNGNMCMVYNHSTPEAYEYHIKMGMLPLNKLNDDDYDNKMILSAFANPETELNHSGLPVEDFTELVKNLNSPQYRSFVAKYPNATWFDYTYLFYKIDSNSGIDYNSLPSILCSLPASNDSPKPSECNSMRGGKKRKSRKCRKSRKYRKSRKCRKSRK